MATGGETVYNTETLPDARQEAERRALELAAAAPAVPESEYTDLP